MYRRFALAVGVFAAVAILAFVAAPLHAQTISPVAPPKCSDAGSAAVSTGYLAPHQVLSVSVPAVTTPNPPPPTWTRYCGHAVALVRHAGTFRPYDVSIQLGGRAFDMPEEISGGTVTVGRSLREGTFSFRLRDATRVTGSWSCG